MHDPRVPETLDGWSLLHQMFRVRWPEWLALSPRDRQATRRGGRRGARGHEPGRGGRHRARLAARAQGRPDARPFPARLRGARGRPARGRAARPRQGARGQHVVRVRGRAGHVRDDGAPARAAPRARPAAGHARVRARLRRRDGGAAKAGDGAALPRRPAAPARVLLPDEQAPRRAEELVRGAGRGPRPDDARPRRDRPPLRGRGHADHLGVDRLRRLGMGRGPVRRRPARLQEADLRDAFRRGLGLVRRVRSVLHRPAVLAGGAAEAASRARCRPLLAR